MFGGSLISCSLQSPGWLHYECVGISAWKYCEYLTGHLLAFRKQGVKFVQLYQSVLQQLTFVLVVSFLLTLNTSNTLL